MTMKVELAQKAAALVCYAYEAGWIGGIRHVGGVVSAGKITPVSLLMRFSDLYGEIPLSGAMIQPGRELWRDYYEFIGIHMILTEDGWEPGEAKQSYLDEWKKNPEWSNPILDEVNAPAETQG